MKKIISIEGPIAAGKSTVLQQLSSSFPPNTRVLQEPVADFCSYRDFNPLQLTYENPKENAAMCQMHIISCLERFYREQQGPSDGELWVTERSLFSPVIFTRALEASGFLSPFSACKILEKAEETLALVNPDHPLGADKIFFIDCPVDVCIERIKQRQRPEEENLHKNYRFLDYLFRLETLYSKHRDCFAQEKGDRSVCVVNYDSPRLAEHLLNFVYETN
jgi:deoxyadenosine/deoxycytidine kinase